MKRRLALGFAALCGVLALLSLDAYSFRPLISMAHPSVEWIDSSTLEGRLERGDVTLIDARSDAEYEESHIPSALQADDVPPNGRDVVVYCSLGVRSADHAARLVAEGFRVFNLDGGIFAWSNEGRPLENESGATRQVHPYNWFFSYFLDDEPEVD